MFYKFKDWRKIVAEKDAEIARLNAAYDRVIDRLEENAKQADEYCGMCFRQNDMPNHYMNAGRCGAYVRSINIVKEEVKGIKSKWM